MFPKGTKLTQKTVLVSDVYVPDFDHLNYPRIEEYVGYIRDFPGKVISPIYVVKRPYNGKTYKVYDGRHRYLAHIIAQREEIMVLEMELPY